MSSAADTVSVYTMPLPGSAFRLLTSQASRAVASGRVRTPSRRDRRASGPRMVITSSRPDAAPPSCSATSAMTRSLAVAVVASTGTSVGSAVTISRSRR